MVKEVEINYLLYRFFCSYCGDHVEDIAGQKRSPRPNDWCCALDLLCHRRNSNDARRSPRKQLLFFVYIRGQK